MKFDWPAGGNGCPDIGIAQFHNLEHNQHQAGCIQIQDQIIKLFDAKNTPNAQADNKDVNREQNGMVVKQLQSRDGAGGIIDVAIGKVTDQKQRPDQGRLDAIT